MSLRAHLDGDCWYGCPHCAWEDAQAALAPTDEEPDDE